MLQVAVVYTPGLQRAFGTVALAPATGYAARSVASSVLWVREAGKLLGRAA